MELRAPKGQYRVIGLDPVDTLTWPSGPLSKDCETFDKALDLAASNDELYLWIYIYNDNGEILHEAGWRNNVPAERRTNVPKHKVVALKGPIFAYSPKH
jgi:hypothetical protein